MLRVGLTGGIGSGKSTVARRLVEHGAVLVDSDVLAREVVAEGSEGLAEVVAAFGAEVVGPDGELDRPRMATLVFADPAARDRLNAIVHPRVRRRSEQLVAAAPAGAVVVQDVPLLVEGGMAPTFPMVVVVHAEAEVRVRRLVAGRGMPESDARARIAAQADDAERRAAADVLLDNSGSPADLEAAVDALWAGRLVPFAENMRLRRPARGGSPRLVDPDPGWPADAARIAARIEPAAGKRGRGVAHIGSTAISGLPAKDIIDVQLAVDTLADADAIAGALADAGFPNRPEITRDNPKPAQPDPQHWRKRYHASADPGRLVHVHVRELGSPGWRYALLLRDWLRADGAARVEYLALKRRAAAEFAADPDAARYAAAKEPWFDAALPRAERWASDSGWSPAC
ncbi:dephospho-CoA kinase [Pseudonocardia asaccharolytica]|uniref:Dephospho-CoA kinase n=1 Tax=Pseudonocardia asaccharolytica DSM 44247 = NBRC 16224 TaxID=1123024 RepID=A0A511D407_9PSEU|nr:dephospho-CoA kinase [Pseudonocardia asaccharolytica]GEL19522.1 dephospho-CoA kinase [Pseudonocardia asaccharolytica DSM 44247 = NBRC 16224]